MSCGARSTCSPVHKNRALDTLDFTHDWILFVDADECVTPALAGEIRDIVEDRAPLPARTRRSPGTSRAGNLFQGKWIRHGGMYPDYQMRLLRRGRARYEDRIVHEHMVSDGPCGLLPQPLHPPRPQGIERYFGRHNHYTSLEAVEVHRMLERGVRDRVRRQSARIGAAAVAAH